MPADDASRLAAEQRARVLIDAQLTATVIQDPGDIVVGPERGARH
jgi:hypothetical protein